MNPAGEAGNPVDQAPIGYPGGFEPIPRQPGQDPVTTETVRRMRFERDLHDGLKCTYPGDDLDDVWRSVISPLLREPRASRNPELLAQVACQDETSYFWNRIRWILATFDDALAEED